MKPKDDRNQTTKERRWVSFNNGCIHGVHHSELMMVRSRPGQSVVQDSIALCTVSKTFAFIAALAAVVVLMLLLSGCSTARPQKGGQASSSITRPGHTNLVTLSQPENPKEPSRQIVQNEQTIEYVLPAGTAISLEDGTSKSGDGGSTRVGGAERPNLKTGSRVQQETSEVAERKTIVCATSSFPVFRAFGGLRSMNANSIFKDGFSNPETERRFISWDAERAMKMIVSSQNCGACQGCLFLADAPGEYEWLPCLHLRPLRLELGGWERRSPPLPQSRVASRLRRGPSAFNLPRTRPESRAGLSFAAPSRIRSAQSAGLGANVFVDALCMAAIIRLGSPA